MAIILKILLAVIFLLSQATPIFAQVVINEFSSGSTSDWVELFFASNATESADLSLYQLEDSGSNIKTLSGLISPGGFSVTSWSNRLNNAGDTIKLVQKSNNSVIDQISYGDDGKICAPSVDKSIGRSSDGGGSFVRFASQTQGSSNTAQQEACPTPSPTPEATPESDPESSPEPSPSPSPAPSSATTIVATKTSSRPISNNARSGTANSQDMLTNSRPKDVLGEGDENPEDKSITDKATLSFKEINPYIIAIIFIVLGLGLTVGTGIYFIKTQHKTKSDSQDNLDKV